MAEQAVTHKYELVLIVDVRLTDEQKEAVRKDVAAQIEKTGGKVINSQVWLEKQKFTFPVRKCAEGTYFLINMEAEASAIAQLQAPLKLNEEILRFVFTKVA